MAVVVQKKKWKIEKELVYYIGILLFRNTHRNTSRHHFSNNKMSFANNIKMRNL